MNESTKDASPVNSAPTDTSAGSWYVYLLECRNASVRSTTTTLLYCGITNNLPARFTAHVNGKGARYTRAHPPLRIVASCAFADRSSASKAEFAVKRLPSHRKEAWLKEHAAAVGYAGQGFAR